MKNKKTLDFQKFIKWFKDGEKPKNQWKIGTEHGKFLFKKIISKDLVMKMKMVLNLFWKKFQKDDWNKICENKNIIGLKHISGSSISLEIYGQFEIIWSTINRLTHDM